ncbi:MAG: hypothetical protein AUH95_00240 [Nitrospirae bacterium 13_2_20CM_2_63_8]|nr:MAG: hypothetical protein AUH95_00240 [Nitrospirae bacterium 13_2_20CM_2_63_8]
MRVCQNELSLRFAIACCALSTMASTAQAETWRCTKPDGSVVYSDQNLSGECRKLEALPPLLRVPSVPPVPAEEGKPEAAKPALPEPAQVPTPGRGRRIDPPSDAIITIRDLKAVPNFNSLLGIANFQATMLLENGDTEWTAERVCINVRFRDISMIFLDVQQVGCLEELKPLDSRQFTVTYTGMIPPRLFPIRAEAKVDYVKWTK